MEMPTVNSPLETSAATERPTATESVAPTAKMADGVAPRPLRIAVVTPIPTPYRDPFWNQFAGAPGIDLSVFYCSAGKADRPWSSNWDRAFAGGVVPGWNLLRWRGADSSCFWNPGIIRRLAAGRFDAILIGGYNHLTMWMAMLYATSRRIPWFLMCESHLRSNRSGWKQRLKRPILRWIMKRAAGCLPTGRWSSEFVCHYGADPKALTLLPNVPDVVALHSRVADLRHTDDASDLGDMAGRPMVLFVGRLIPKKRAELVIRAFHEIHEHSTAILTIVGDGPLRPELEILVDELGLRGRVHFAGFVEPDEVARWYARATVFVLPSSETWGVVVIEALAAGVPVIVSDEVGCQVDTVIDPALGTVVPARDQAALRDALAAHLQGCGGNSPAFQKAWAAREAAFRYDALAASLERALRARVVPRTCVAD
jgi:glycosyltransferase involved in cell wall biosynthesis